MTSPIVGLVNPLPRALAHYQAALATTLQASGAEVSLQRSVSVELGGNRVAKACAVAAAIHERRSRPSRDVDKLLVLWPAFGYLDLALWNTRGTDSAVIIHDPLPLRPQFGLSRASATMARLSRHRPEVIVHSLAANERGSHPRNRSRDPASSSDAATSEPVDTLRRGYRPRSVQAVA